MGGWTLYCGTKLLLPVPEEASRCGTTVAVTVISRVFKSFSLISNVAPLSLQSMVSLTSPPKEIRRQPALRLLPRVTFAVTVVSSFDNAMFGASGSPQIFSDGDAADSALQLILLWALTVAVMAVPSEMSLLLNVNDSSVAVLPVSLVCGAPAPVTVTE